MTYSPVEEKDAISSLDFDPQERFNLRQVVFRDKFSVAEAHHLGSVLSIHEAVRVEGEVLGMTPYIVNAEAYILEHQVRVPLILSIFGDVDKYLEGLLFLV